MFIAPNFQIHPAPLGAECKLHLSNNMALRWSAGRLEVKDYKHCAPPEHFASQALNQTIFCKADSFSLKLHASDTIVSSPFRETTCTSFSFC